MSKAVLFILCTGWACAQQTPQFSIFPGPPGTAYQKIFKYSGGNLVAVCMAKTDQLTPSPPISISAASNASPVSFTTTHGFDWQSATTTTPTITISGGTGNWAAVNGTWTFTPTSATTGTIPVDSTAFGALTGTLTFTTRAPRVTQPVWAITYSKYDGSNNIIWNGWAANPSISSTGAPAEIFVCANSSSLGAQ